MVHDCDNGRKESIKERNGEKRNGKESEYSRPYAFVMINIALNVFRHIISRNLSDVTL